MKIEDRLFIFITVMLALLFGAAIIDNISFSTTSASHLSSPHRGEGKGEPRTNILKFNTLVRGEGREAEYYKIIP